MKHVKANWKTYAVGLTSVLVAGAASQGYIPQEVASWLGGLLSLFSR